MEGYACSIKRKISEVRLRRYFSVKGGIVLIRIIILQAFSESSPRSELTFGKLYSLNSDPNRNFTTEQGVQGGVLVRNFANYNEDLFGKLYI